MKESTPRPTPLFDSPTTVYTGEVSAPAPSRPRCPVALVSASGGQFTGELQGLLRSRLRLVTLLILAPCLFFFFKNLVDSHERSLFGWIDLLFLAGVLAVLAGFAALLWSRRPLSFRALRGIEVGTFGLLALFFAWQQYELFHSGGMFHAASRADALCADCPPDETATQTVSMIHLAAVSSTLRWFFLIVLYGVFIPNTGRRCAWIVGCTALVPLALTASTALMHGTYGSELYSNLLDMAVVLGVAVAVAVFGSSRIQVLQRQAFEAKELGQYRLKERLGAGGMGEVYLAEHLLLRRPCAVKLIRPDQAGNATNLQRFEREVRAMATLTHWNTVEVFDYGHAQDGTFYYVMEYLPGLNLDTLVARYGPLPPERAIHFLRQVCRALREAHGVGLLHRDVKPSNVIACERGGVYDVAKLLDFGLVQDLGLGVDSDKLTLKGTILGSPPYVSPEQAKGKSDLDSRSDIYSLGGVAYYLLTGQPPFVRENALQMLLAHAHEPVVPPIDLNPAVPSDLQAVVLRCLEKDPERRYPDAAALERALAACELADLWTEERAEDWWKKQADGRLNETRLVLEPTGN
jgi:eukaryotic-like serine/threonine-protein kinase